MNGMSPSHVRVHQEMEFHQIKSNFIKAARHGLAAKLEWMGEEYDAKELIINELIPLAKDGLNKTNIDSSDQDKYLGILHDRVESSKTGSSWILNSFNSLIKSNPQDTVLSGLTEFMRQRQKQNQPVHLWPPISQEDISIGPYRFKRIDQIMSKELYTVYEEDLIDLVPNIMKWNKVRHMLVENREGELVGLITLGRLGKYYSEKRDQKPVLVKEVMVDDVITVNPETKTLQAIQIMQQHSIGCLPVLNQDKKLVGVVTEKDLLPVAALYLQQ
jgi:CBS domain-containing protein